MAFCQSLNKVQQKDRSNVTDQLMPVFKRHVWKKGECVRCFKTRNPAMANFGHKSTTIELAKAEESHV